MPLATVPSVALTTIHTMCDPCAPSAMRTPSSRLRRAMANVIVLAIAD